MLKNAAILVLLAMAKLLLVASPIQAEQIVELRQVKAEMVCMMNDTYFGRPQIPVPIGDKVYYGCCEHCKASLAENEALRQAVDPVSQKKLDKADAFIGAGADGSVMYFENVANLQSYRSKAVGK